MHFWFGVFCVCPGWSLPPHPSGSGSITTGESQPRISCESREGEGQLLPSRPGIRLHGDVVRSLSDKIYSCRVVFACFFFLSLQHCDCSLLACFSASLLLERPEPVRAAPGPGTQEHPVPCWGPPPLPSVTLGPATASELPKGAIPRPAPLFSAPASGLFATL